MELPGKTPGGSDMEVHAIGPTRAYWREILTVLAAKTAALVLLYVLFFAAPPSLPAPEIHLFHQGAPR